MERFRKVSETHLRLAFAATCVEALARTLGVSYYDAFRRLKEADLFNSLIFPYYDTMHTESREVVVQRLIEALSQSSPQNE